LILACQIWSEYRQHRHVASRIILKPDPVYLALRKLEAEDHRSPARGRATFQRQDLNVSSLQPPQP